MKINPSLNLRGELVSFEQARVMGILNVNSDSFFAGSRVSIVDEALKLAEKHIAEGADFIDIGATSTRPGSLMSDPDTEWKVLFPILKAVRKIFPEVFISVDTYHSSVMKHAFSEGVDLINDISAGKFDAAFFETLIQLKLPYVLSHIQGIPETMQQKPEYSNVLAEVLFELSSKVNLLRDAGLANLIIDPGFGFGKTVEQNYMLLSHLREFTQLKAPVLIGVSRKSMVTKVLDVSVDEALNGTSILHVLALQNGANILRVHDVKEAVEAIKITAKTRLLSSQ
jgi:dihydropteroate synthase